MHWPRWPYEINCCTPQVATQSHQDCEHGVPQSNTWAMGVDETNLKFDRFALTSLLAAVVPVSYTVMDDKPRW